MDQLHTRRYSSDALLYFIIIASMNWDIKPVANQLELPIINK